MNEIKKNSTRHGWTEQAAREKFSENTGTDGEPKEESKRTEMSARENKKETRLEDFIVPSLPTEEESSQPKNLLDDSICHLHGLMKSAGREATKDRRLDPAFINAQCNIAKNLRDMMKLKLDIYAEGNKK